MLKVITLCLSINVLLVVCPADPYTRVHWWQNILSSSPNQIAAIFAALEHALTMGTFSDEVIARIDQLPDSIDTDSNRLEFIEGLKTTIIEQLIKGFKNEEAILKRRPKAPNHEMMLQRLNEFYAVLYDTIKNWNMKDTCLQDIIKVRNRKRNLDTRRYKQAIQVALIREVIGSEKRYHEYNVTKFIRKGKSRERSQPESSNALRTEFVECQFEALRFVIMLSDFSKSVADKIREMPSTFEPKIIMDFFLRRLRNAIIDEVEKLYIIEIENEIKNPPPPNSKRRIHKFYPFLLNAITNWNLSRTCLFEILDLRNDSCAKLGAKGCINALKVILKNEILSHENDFRHGCHQRIFNNVKYKKDD